MFLFFTITIVQAVFSQAVGDNVVKDLCSIISSPLLVHVVLQGMWCTGCDNCLVISACHW